jgi:hypothetical protein
VKVKTSTESFLEQTGMIDITLITQNENDEELFKRAENSIEPVRINQITFNPKKNGKREMWVRLTIGKNK